MRLLHVIGSVAPRYGGPSIALPQMCRALAARGHTVEVFTTDIDGEARLPVPVGTPIEANGYTITYFPVGRPRSYVASPSLARALWARVKDFDLVHIHSLYLFHTSAAALACRRHRVPYVVRPHGTLDPYHRARHRLRKAIYWAAIERASLRGAAGIHYTTAAEQEHAERAGVQTRGFVVPLGVDAAEFSRPEPDTALPVGFPPEGPVITFLGRLTEKKRIDVLLRAFAELVASGSDATLAVAGPDSEGLRGRLEAASAALGLEGRVMFPGMVLGTAKVALLQRSDLFVLPSEDESFGVSVLEAMAAGVPVIVSPGVALHPVVTEYQAGLVAPTEAGALCRAMATILTDRDLAQQMGANGRSLAARQFSWESVGEGLEAMYGQALESSPVVTRTPR